MKQLADHDVHFWLTGAQWLALKHLAEADDRHVSNYVRRLVAEHLESVSVPLAEKDREGAGAGREEQA